jgi:thymidylate synthase
MRAQNAKNTYGTYFERLVAFRGSVRKNDEYQHKTTNQLDHLIQIWKKREALGARPRHSALVMSCFDPTKDHTGQQLRGFPCLTQVSFGYDDNGGLSLTAFYPTQYLFDRAYGNYLGLANLGNFVAEQMGLTLVQLNFFIGRPEIGSVSKEQLRELASTVKTFLPNNFEGGHE